MSQDDTWLNSEHRFDGSWNSPRVGVPLWIVFGGVTLYWSIWVPPPGYAIGALAVVAGIMSVREMKTRAKVSWVFLLVCLLVMEFRAIDKDRSENDKKQREFFGAQKQGFQDIATQADTNFKETAGGLEQAIKQGQKQFETTTGQLSENFRGQIGSNSFCYISLGGRTPEGGHLMFESIGRYPLHNVVARFVNQTELRNERAKGKTIEPEKSGREMQIGEIAAGRTGLLDWVDLEGETRFDFLVQFSALNGNWIEHIRLMKIDGQWQQAIKVGDWQFTDIKNPKKDFSPKPDKGFPLVDGKVNWNN